MSRHDATADVGLLVIGHGTRDTEGLAEFEQVVAHAAERYADQVVERGYLELAEPTILQGIARLVERGVRRIDVVPLLLFAAGHARRDIPALLAEARGQFSQVEIVQHDVLGCHPRVVELSALRYREALTGHEPVAAEETALVLVGRGSLDSDATAAMLRFAELRRELTPVRDCWVGFVAMAKPTLAEALQQAATSDARRIVVQPHLLFRGQLLADVEQAVANARLIAPHKHWLIAPRLGVHRWLVETWENLGNLTKMRDRETQSSAGH
ncbi:MAG: sirohydrochlorin chelatase [Planctomycetaceae bacterium]|nr:sirohydrochlorin chelatase [Planctomycetaceae bacterium]